ncbi:MAG: plastocyanin/azurin family copper-binding protein [Tunicatimonas sp.]
MKKLLIIIWLLGFINPFLRAQDSEAQQEAAYYTISTVPIPDSVILEVGGLAFTNDNQLGVSTRRGEVWLIDNPQSGQPTFRRFAAGLHEPLGLAYRNGSFYTAQRAELTKLTDTNQDGRADVFRTLYTWPLSGNYHEYSYGPLFLPDGDMLVTLNLSWVGEGASLSKWRGWMLKISEDGTMKPIATGLRSPAGFGFNAEGDVFYAENQGDWIASGRITHLEEGDFAGNPAGLRWTNDAASPLKMKRNYVPDSVGLMHEFAQNFSSMKLPTVWFPHTIMGISTSDIVTDTTGGGFGPFTGQLFVGDQGHSKIMRVFLEKVNGEYQGACFAFKEGFASGLLRMRWGPDDALYVGMTSRGWRSTGSEPYGLQRLRWMGQTPFEIKTMRAQSNGFLLEFTEPVDEATAALPDSYAMTSFTYKYHRTYGSPIINQQPCPVQRVEVSADRLSARLFVSGLREGYIHELKAPGVRNRRGKPLLHADAYYTLNNRPEGETLDDHTSHEMIADATLTEPRDCARDDGKRVLEMPTDWEAADVTITVGTEPGLQYDLKSFEVRTGERVELKFNNNDDMMHNLVVVAPNTADEVGTLAMNLGLDGPQQGYVPEVDEVLFHTCILQPGSAESIYFTAPAPGEYTYVCTFPGHSRVMRGTMIVRGRETAER